MRHRDKHKTVFFHLVQLEKIRINRTYVHKSQCVKLDQGYCDLVYHK